MRKNGKLPYTSLSNSTLKNEAKKWEKHLKQEVKKKTQVIE